MQLPHRTQPVALVTGGASGIGAATVRQLASRGISTVVADVDLQSAERLCEEVNELASSRPVRCDVSDASDVDRAAEVAEAMGDWQTLVCCAGWPGEAARLERTPLAEWERVFAINTMGVVFATRAATSRMRRRQRGSIVLVASIAGVTGSRGQVPYSGAKAAVIGITRAAAKELIHEGIRVNAVAPGFIETPMTAAMSLHDRSSWRIDKLTLEGRLGKASEVANAIDFLASDAASYITGTTLIVDGGFTLGSP